MRGGGWGWGGVEGGGGGAKRVGRTFRLLKKGDEAVVNNDGAVIHQMNGSRELSQ